MTGPEIDIAARYCPTCGHAYGDRENGCTDCTKPRGELTLNLGGVPIAEDETPFCGTNHKHPGDVIGYAAVLTAFGHGRVRDLAYFDAHCYGECVKYARQVRREVEDYSRNYCRIDVLYNDGCRGIL